MTGNLSPDHDFYGDNFAAESPAFGLSERERTAALLEEVLTNSHPVVAEGIRLAAVPRQFDLELLTQLRRRDDGKDEKMLRRLAALSFVESDADWHQDKAYYTVLPLQRELLQERFIALDQDRFLQAQADVLEHLRDHPAVDDDMQTQFLLYHQLLLDSQFKTTAGLESIAFLIDRFRTYTTERRLGTIESLLSTAEEAVPYLDLLQAAWLPDLRDLIRHLKARLLQLRGQWAASRPILTELRQQKSLWPQLTPYVERAYANTLLNDGQYVAAIETYQQAIELFKKLSAAPAETSPNQYVGAAAIQADEAMTMWRSPTSTAATSSSLAIARWRSTRSPPSW